jgi:hypothetical protein
LLRHRAVFPSGLGRRGSVKAFHLARIEQFAARLVIREDVALVHSHFAWPEGIAERWRRRRRGGR